jgi:hypothetical protein
MFVVDTDTMTLLQRGHGPVTERFHRASREVVTTIISRIEILDVPRDVHRYPADHRHRQGPCLLGR